MLNAYFLFYERSVLTKVATDSEFAARGFVLRKTRLLSGLRIPSPRLAIYATRMQWVTVASNHGFESSEFCSAKLVGIRLSAVACAHILDSSVGRAHDCEFAIRRSDTPNDAMLHESLVRSCLWQLMPSSGSHIEALTLVGAFCFVQTGSKR